MPCEKACILRRPGEPTPSTAQPTPSPSSTSKLELDPSAPQPKPGLSAAQLGLKHLRCCFSFSIRACQTIGRVTRRT